MLNKLSRQFHDGRIILESRTGVKVAIRALIAVGATALGGLLLVQTNDAPNPPSTPTYQPRSGPTFELPHSDDGPNSTIDSYSFQTDQTPTLTTLANTENTP